MSHVLHYAPGHSRSATKSVCMFIRRKSPHLQQEQTFVWHSKQLYEKLRMPWAYIRVQHHGRWKAGNMLLLWTAYYTFWLWRCESIFLQNVGNTSIFHRGPKKEHDQQYLACYGPHSEHKIMVHCVIKLMARCLFSITVYFYRYLFQNIDQVIKIIIIYFQT